MRRKFGIVVLLIAGVLLTYVSAEASGSASAGKGISSKNSYTLGKVITYEKLVCPSCPLQKEDLNRDRAMSLKNSIDASNDAEKPGTPDDAHIQILCPGSQAVQCDSGVNEQDLVRFYLTKRYRL